MSIHTLDLGKARVFDTIAGSIIVDNLQGKVSIYILNSRNYLLSNREIPIYKSQRSLASELQTILDPNRREHLELYSMLSLVE